MEVYVVGISVTGKMCRKRRYHDSRKPRYHLVRPDAFLEGSVLDRGISCSLTLEMNKMRQLDHLHREQHQSKQCQHEEAANKCAEKPQTTKRPLSQTPRHLEAHEGPPRWRMPALAFARWRTMPTTGTSFDNQSKPPLGTS